jgi:hypothetical protein
MGWDGMGGGKELKGEVGTGVRFADDCGPGSSGWRDL